MHAKREWFWFFLIIIIIIFVLFNLRSLGFAVVNTTSNVTVHGLNSPPVIGELNSSIYVCESQSLFHLFYATDPDGDALTKEISPQNPFFLFWISQTAPNNHTFAIVSGTLDKSDLGAVNVGYKLFEETVSISDGYSSDCCTDTANTNITIIEINNIPQVEDLGVHTIWNKGSNSTFYEKWNIADTEYDNRYGSLMFNITIWNSTGSVVNLFNITYEGIMNFTADLSTPLGVYNIRVCVNDTALTNVHPRIFEECSQTGGVNRVCDNFSLTVTEENRAPNITSYYPENLSLILSGVSSLYFNITKEDPDGTIPDAYWYINDSLQEIDSGSSFDEFSYNLGCGTSGNIVVMVNITDGLLNDSLQWNVTYSAAGCPSPTPPSGGGGGGGGGALLANFELEPEFITTSLFQQEGKSFDIKITNIGTTKINILTSVKNLSEMALLGEENITLNTGEEKIIHLYLYSLSETPQGVYFGEILFKSGIVKKSVKVVLEIKEREALFDIKVSVPPNYKVVNSGDNLKVLVDMLNVGLYGTPVDVRLYLYITDLNKILIYEASKEIIAVETNISVVRDLYVPSKTVPGTYLVLGEAKYTNITVTTYDTFTVVEKKYLRASYFIIIIGVIALIIFIFFLLYKRRKKREYEN